MAKSYRKRYEEYLDSLSNMLIGSCRGKGGRREDWSEHALSFEDWVKTKQQERKVWKHLQQKYQGGYK